MLSRNTVIVIALSALILFVTSCSDESYKSIKLNADMVKEYNDAIGLYNKIAISFTAVARLVEDENANNTVFTEGFWQEFNEKSDKVYENIGNMSNFVFTYEQTGQVMQDIQLFVRNIREYIEYTASFRDNAASMTQETFINNHRDMYSAIMDESARIVEKFDYIYRSCIVDND